MNNLLDVPIASVTALTPERAVFVLRAILRSECGYAKLSPNVLTISSRLTIADGGIDAEINVSATSTVPADCLFQSGLTGFQIKSGTGFKPWTSSAIVSELLDSRGNLYSEVDRLIQKRGRYTLICTGHDLTPEQRNDSRHQIYGAIRASLEKAGTPVGAMDMLIAAHARNCGATLVTNNLREFERIKGLMVVNWA